MSRVLLTAVLSYLLGSIPFGYLLVRVFRGEDVRQSGSGNIGATNVSRRSPLLGGVTLLLDAVKGAAAVVLAVYLTGATWGGVRLYQTMAMAAFLAVLGHSFPIWLRFHGGKGVATGLGSFLMITPNTVLLAAVVFVVIVAIFRYVSLGSIVAVACYPIIALKGVLERGGAVALALISATSLLIIARHHENIRRLLAGTENRLGAKRT
jgi:acyl phosphate:glycerol-3-phosphate acyltransferase